MKPTKCRAKQEKIMQEERNKRKRKKKGKEKVATTVLLLKLKNYLEIFVSAHF